MPLPAPPRVPAPLGVGPSLSELVASIVSDADSAKDVLGLTTVEQEKPQLEGRPRGYMKSELPACAVSGRILSNEPGPPAMMRTMIVEITWALVVREYTAQEGQATHRDLQAAWSNHFGSSWYVGTTRLITFSSHSCTIEDISPADPEAGTSRRNRFMWISRNTMRVRVTYPDPIVGGQE
jgi:hypothetical protein